MDVRFSNVVEVTRQYFQGVPPGVGSGPPAGQAPAQRPRSSGASQAVYPPVSLAPSPLPYPNQQNHHRLPSIGSFAGGQQRSTSALPPMNQVKQSLSAQDYTSGYSGRVPSSYKYAPDQQQASAALYNAAVSPSVQAVHRQSISPRSQTSHQLPINGGNHHAATQSQSYHSTSMHHQVPGQQVYGVQQSSNHLTTHQQLSDATQQLALLQAGQSSKLGHLSSNVQSQSSHPRQSPVNSTHQFFNSNQQFLSNQSQNSQHHHQNLHRQELRTMSQSVAQHHPASRQQSSIPHAPQQPPGSNQHLTHHQHVPSQTQQVLSHRQQSTSQIPSSHRLVSSASSYPDLAGQHLSNSHHPSHMGQQLSHQQMHESSVNIKTQIVQQSYSQTSSQEISRQLQSFSQTSTQQITRQIISHLHQGHHSVSQQRQPNLQSSYHQQHHHHTGSNLSSPLPTQRLSSPSPLHHSTNLSSVSGQNQHMFSSLQHQQSRSTHSAQSAYATSSSANQKAIMSSSSNTNQSFTGAGSSRNMMHTRPNSGVTSMSHSRDTLSTLTHPHIANSSSSASRELSSSSNHINIANLITNSLQDGAKSSLPNITNLMSTAQLQHSNLVSSRSPSINQMGSTSQRKHNSFPSNSVSGMSVINSAAMDNSSVLNLSEVQNRSVINLPNTSSSRSVSNSSNAPSQRSILSGVIKRESPLDLSVKTVRQSADSTAADEEYMNYVYNHSPDLFQRKTPPKASPFPVVTSPFDMAAGNNRPVSAPKVDFTPDFSSSAHMLPKKNKPENQQFINSLPSISSFVKPQLPQSKANVYSLSQSGPSTSGAGSFSSQTQQTYTDPQKDSSFHTTMKRPAEEPPPAQPPSKMPRSDDSWRLSIDRQIENKLNSYLSSKTLNGERSFEPPPQNFRYPQYPQYSPKPQPEKPVVNGQADKRVLNILRSSLESKEARNKAVFASQPESPKAPPTAPVRQNLPPFGAIGNYPKELPPQKAKPLEIVDITDDMEESETKKPSTNGNATNGELDGLAAFLAARIRTKAELKQQHVDPGGTGTVKLGSSPIHVQPLPSLNQNTFTPNRVVKTEEESGTSPVVPPAKAPTVTVSPPKLTKEQGTSANSPRKRDSDSDCEAPPVLERQRKSASINHQNVEVVTHVPVPPQESLPDPPTPPAIKEEDLPDEEKDWLKRCDQLIDQLKASSSTSPRKKKFKKRRLKIKPLPKQEPREDTDIKEDITASVKTEPSDTPTQDSSSQPHCANELVVKQEPQDEREDERAGLSSAVVAVPAAAESTESEMEETEILWQRRGKMLIRKKKPLGDGSHFEPGWQDQVYRYKQSLRMPDSLITIARPTSSLPDLQNYMDSPTATESTTPDSTPTKPMAQPDTLSDAAQSLSKEKTILDELMERFKLNRSEPEAQDSNNPYLDYLNKEKKKYRGRSHTRTFLNKKATFKEIFGEERPASAPPAGVGENERKKSSHRHAKVILRSMLKLRSKRNLRDRLPTAVVKPKKRRGPRPRSDRQSNQQPTSGTPASQIQSPLIKVLPKKSKTIKRKGKSSGFDYIKKKKKIIKDPNKPEGKRKTKKKKCVPMTESEIKEELKSWVLNKCSGESILQRASRLGYTEVVQYCLSILKEKATCRDFSGFTPLHEAASQGHIDIAKLLIDNGASVNQPAQGGIRPLHEAAENGFTDLMEVLLRFGADAELATSSGQTALSLATDDRAKRVIMQYIKSKPFENPVQTIQYSVPLQPTSLMPLPVDHGDSEDSSLEGFEIEESDVILPSLYRLSGEPRSSSWILFHELSPLVRAKTRDSLLRRIGATKQDIRDMRPTDFYLNARTRTLVMGDTERKPPKLSAKMSRVTLVRYTQAVRLLLNVETTVIPR